jgi:SPASM domain peptide maturase of grasp-with-spasm system
MMNDVFMLYASCIAVKGYRRTAIYDLQRGNIHFAPNSLYSLLSEDRYLDIKRILENLGEEDKETFFEYITALEKAELGFFCSSSDVGRFPGLPSEWLFPGHITNCILDAESVLWYFNEGLLKELEELCCDYIQIRFFHSVTYQHLENIFSLVRASCIKGMDVLLPKSDCADFYNRIKSLVNQTSQVQTLIIHSDIEDRLLQPGANGMQQVLLSSSVISGAHHCGIVSRDYFAINIPHFTESLQHNTCVNRKIGIDKDGEIKNCPSMQTSYGNIADICLQDAIEKQGFKKMWDISKNQISICKDCEFRHACTDCRAYLEKPNNIYSKPLKCGYNPYTLTWEDWATNPLKERGKNYYSL